MRARVWIQPSIMSGILGVVLGTAFSAGCSLEVPRNTSLFRIVLEEQSPVDPAQLSLLDFNPSSLLSTLSSAADLPCFAVNVTGPGISPQFRSNIACTHNDNFHGRGPGITSRVTARNSMAELDLPGGIDRHIDIFGLDKAVPECGGLTPSSSVSLYYIGGKTVNLTEPQTVSISVALAAGAQPSLVCEKSSEPDEPTGTSGGSGTAPVKYLDSSWITMTNLVAYFKLDESPAAHLASIDDSSPTNLTASFSTSDGATDKSTIGKVDGALSFDGVNDYVNAPEVAGGAIDFANGNAITITAWIYPTSLPTYSEILCKGSNYGLQTGTGTGSEEQRLMFYYFDGTTWHNFGTNTPVLTANQWNHVAVTYTFGTAGSAILYVNGNQAIGSWSSGNGNAAPAVNGSPLTVGYCPSDTSFSGKIDDVSVWKRALTAAEILAIYNRPNI